MFSIVRTFFLFQGKLVKLFSRQLVVKQKCNNEDWNHNEKLRYYPKLEQWLQVVGINEEAIKVDVYYFMYTPVSNALINV